jgi:hypothetical protein
MATGKRFRFIDGLSRLFASLPGKNAALPQGQAQKILTSPNSKTICREIVAQIAELKGKANVAEEKGRRVCVIVDALDVFMAASGCGDLEAGDLIAELRQVSNSACRWYSVLLNAKLC